MIRVWHSFSCNNSTAYRLVARFPDAHAAAEVAAELTDYFRAQEALGVPRLQNALVTLSRSYGFEWTEVVRWGEPGVLLHDELVIVYHTVSLGMGPGLPAYIADRDGVAEDERAIGIQISVLAHVDPARAQRFDEIVAAIAPLLDDEQRMKPAPPPWSEVAAWGHASWFRDGGTLGIHLPIRAHELDAFTKWLALDDVVLRVEDRDDFALFTALAKARCTACDRKLDYLDPRLDDIETAQLLCHTCGGLYDLAAFT